MEPRSFDLSFTLRPSDYYVYCALQPLRLTGLFAPLAAIAFVWAILSVPPTLGKSVGAVALTVLIAGIGFLRPQVSGAISALVSRFRPAMRRPVTARISETGIETADATSKAEFAWKAFDRCFVSDEVCAAKLRSGGGLILARRGLTPDAAWDPMLEFIRARMAEQKALSS